MECDDGYGYTIQSWNGVELSGSGSFTCEVSDRGYAVCGAGYARAAILMKECTAGEGTAEDPFKDGDAMVMVNDTTTHIDIGATVDVISSIYVNTEIYGMDGIVSLSNGSTTGPITMTALKTGGTTLYSTNSLGTYSHTVNVIGPEYVDLKFLSDPVTDGVISYV